MIPSVILISSPKKLVKGNPIANTDVSSSTVLDFRRSHPALTNQEAMSMFKLDYGHSQHMGQHLWGCVKTSIMTQPLNPIEL